MPNMEDLEIYEQLLLSLSAGDLMTGLAFLSSETLYFSNAELLGDRIIVSIGLLMAFGFSTNNLLLIGVDRLAAVRFPMRHKTWMTRNKMIFIIIGLWTFMILCVPGWILFYKDH